MNIVKAKGAKFPEQTRRRRALRRLLQVGSILSLGFMVFALQRDTDSMHRNYYIAFATHGGNYWSMALDDDQFRMIICGPWPGPGGMFGIWSTVAF